jgi:hypothetical protein
VRKRRTTRKEIVFILYLVRSLDVLILGKGLGKKEGGKINHSKIVSARPSLPFPILNPSSTLQYIKLPISEKTYA